MANQLRIARARSKAAEAEFCELVYRLRGRDPHWVPPLRRDQKILLDRMKHPFHEHAQVEYFVARQGGETIGRIAAIENYAHNEAHGERVGFFGFLDAVDDPEVFRRLLHAAEVWATRRNLTALRGPCSFSTNEECGLLIDSFHTEPSVMTPHNPPFYVDHVEAAGYEKAEDLLCYWLTRDTFTERIPRMADRVQKRLRDAGHTVSVRPLDKSNWAREVALVRKLYNQGWEQNWGFVPMTDAEFAFIAKELKPLADERFIFFIYLDDEPVGFTLALLDYNVVLKHLEGKLGPKQLALFLMLKSNIKAIRLLMLGTLPEYRNRGLDLLMYRDFAASCIEHGIFEGELSWILERNRSMNRALKAMGANVYRTYRIYEKKLAE
ncbi:N-acetyltransferase [bacterium]|nr:N-acetyltransferase [bacterium]